MKRPNILLVLVTLMVVGGCVAFCVVFLVPAYETREKVLSAHTLLRERIRVSRTPPPFYQVDEFVA